jgi:hypothetical protein
LELLGTPGVEAVFPELVEWVSMDPIMLCAESGNSPAGMFRAKFSYSVCPAASKAGSLVPAPMGRLRPPRGLEAIEASGLALWDVMATCLSMAYANRMRRKTPFRVCSIGTGGSKFCPFDSVVEFLARFSNTRNGLDSNCKKTRILNVCRRKKISRQGNTPDKEAY